MYLDIHTALILYVSMFFCVLWVVDEETHGGFVSENSTRGYSPRVYGHFQGECTDWTDEPKEGKFHSSYSFTFCDKHFLFGSFRKDLVFFFENPVYSTLSLCFIFASTCEKLSEWADQITSMSAHTHSWLSWCLFPNLSQIYAAHLQLMCIYKPLCNPPPPYITETLSCLCCGGSTCCSLHLWALMYAYRRIRRCVLPKYMRGCMMRLIWAYYKYNTL